MGPDTVISAGSYDAALYAAGMNYCVFHHFAYVHWLINQRGAMIQQVANSEQKLMQELIKSGL